MIGTLTSKQRQSLIDIVTCVVMKDAYGFRRTLTQIAQPKGDIDYGDMIEMCEEMCGQYTGTDFGDFELGDLLTTVLDSLQSGNFKVDPFLTNLSRGIIAIEGTIKTLSPHVNILNFFTSKVNTGFDFNLNLEHPEEMNPDIAIKLLQLFKGLTDSSTKSAEALDMLEKGQDPGSGPDGYQKGMHASVHTLFLIGITRNNQRNKRKVPPLTEAVSPVYAERSMVSGILPVLFCVRLVV